ncbi:uncharacterized protein LOC135847957 [Planococcus citri]|uniref:uncharacterized protein LOC135847957 n=1 Tax=Planococcus citri TaxID=170843 RepID=UPI0031FA2F58
MGSIPTLYMVVMTVIIGTDLLITTVSSNSRPLIEPLSAQEFTKPVVDLLPPEIFSQRDPLAYFLPKIIKLPDIQKITQDVEYFLSKERFPGRYADYAEFLLLLLEHQMKIEPVTKSIRQIQDSAEFVNLPPAKLPDESAPELVSLFSPGVFSDPEPPLALINELLKIQPWQMFRVRNQLEAILRKSGHLQLIYIEYTRNLYTKYLTDINNRLSSLKPRSFALVAHFHHQFHMPTTKSNYMDHVNYSEMDSSSVLGME